MIDEMGEHSNKHNTTNNGNILLSPVVLESIQNDAQIKALNQRLNELVQYNSPRWVQQTNGEFKAVNSLQFDEAFDKIKQEIEHRQSQIISAYNWH